LRRTVVARTHQEVSKLRYLWDKLEAQHPATMFQSFAWNHAAACVFGERESPFVIYAENDHGAALIPAAIDQSRPRLTLLGEKLFDYRDVLSSGEPDVLCSAWCRASQLGLKFSAGAIRADANVASWSDFDVSHFYGAPKVSLREISVDDFLAKHTRLGRWSRRLEREGIELCCRTGANIDLVRFIYQRKAGQAAETGDSLFADPRRVQFMIEICQTVGSACEIFTFESPTALVAALVTFRDRNVRRFYTVYFDESWARYSPGVVLIHEVTRRSLKAGLECDYMTGEHGYKLRFATSVTSMYWAEATAEMLASRPGYPATLAA
jgi:CelD/BcsL family acetyltransferase involved in cellulose biosynthesis